MNSFSISPDGAFSLSPDPAAHGPSLRERATPLITQYVLIGLRRKWTILGAIAIALLGGVLYTLLATPQYTAVTQMEISREGTRILNNVQGVQPENSADTEFYQTQYTILNSRSLAERVVKDLRLGNDAHFFEVFGAKAMAASLSQGGAESTVTPAQRSATAAQLLLGHLDIQPIRSSRLVDIKWTSPDPALSARVVNSWASSFIRYNLERRYDATAYARHFLEDRLEQLRRKLEQSERQLVGYASQQQLINIPVGGSNSSGAVQERSLTVDRLAALNGSLSEATADRARAQSRLNSVASGTIAEELSNGVVGGLRQRRSELAAEYAKLMGQFEPDYPPAQALQLQLRRIDESIKREQSRVGESLRSAYNDSVDRERILSTKVDSLREAYLDQRRRSIQYNIFQRDVDTNRELYNGLLQRYKEIGIAGGVGENNMAVVDAAEVPGAPSFPRPFLNLLLALVLGTVAGVAAALAREQIDETIADPADLESRIHVPLLGAVPQSKDADPLLDIADPKSSLTEAYLSIQTSLSFSTDHGVPRTLTVTSTRPAEGKSTTAYALAHVIARTGAKTIMIDGDMRSPSLHAQLGIDNERGLSSYLSGTMRLNEVIRTVEGEPFQVMTAGQQPPNAAELLRGRRFSELITELQRQFDHVIIDSPPVMGLADAPIIASQTEGTVFVVEARGVKARLATIALDRLRQSKAHILGSILTKLQVRSAGYGYGYDYGYGYGQKADS